MDKWINVLLCGDVMTGRGVDQVMPYPSNPELYESYVKNATDYVELAKQVNGHIPKPVSFDYIWGDALAIIKKADARIINLETSITQSDNYFDKGINYRMHPKNISCLNVAGIDCCTLANNHVLDWGQEGLLETFETLQKFDIKYAGAGHNIVDAEAPCILHLKGKKSRILTFSYGLPSSGIPNSWKATETKPGVNLLPDLSLSTAQNISRKIATFKQPDDLIIASIHWGGNWGYEIKEQQKIFAHKLIDLGNIAVIHGHSSHHVKGLEVYKNKLIIYGCGDFLNDYEGIKGHRAYRDDLGFMYFVTCNPANGYLISLKMIPTQIKKFQITHPNKKDSNWLKFVLNREGEQFGTGVGWDDNGTLDLIWD